ncbi:hypothetical protein C8J57DRAFT_1254434 [Mycena rebaudengoi]|nr:hypothetical protein C8J57DRAFT_1254434 [Mycena rebaudengoi]
MARGRWDEGKNSGRKGRGKKGKAGAPGGKGARSPRTPHNMGWWIPTTRTAHARHPNSHVCVSNAVLFANDERKDPKTRKASEREKKKNHAQRKKKEIATGRGGKENNKNKNKESKTKQAAHRDTKEKKIGRSTRKERKEKEGDAAGRGGGAGAERTARRGPATGSRTGGAGVKWPGRARHLRRSVCTAHSSSPLAGIEGPLSPVFAQTQSVYGLTVIGLIVLLRARLWLRSGRRTTVPGKESSQVHVHCIRDASQAWRPPHCENRTGERRRASSGWGRRSLSAVRDAPSQVVARGWRKKIEAWHRIQPRLAACSELFAAPQFLALSGESEREDTKESINWKAKVKDPE